MRNLHSARQTSVIPPTTACLAGPDAPLERPQAAWGRPAVAHLPIPPSRGEEVGRDVGRVGPGPGSEPRPARRRLRKIRPADLLGAVPHALSAGDESAAGADRRAGGAGARR